MKNIISMKNVTYTYPEAETHATDDISLDIQENEWVSIVGRNGSGKTTLTKLIDGLIDCDSGDIFIDGVKIDEDNIWDARKNIGIVFQNPDHQFVGATVEDDVAFGLENQGVQREDMIKRVDHALQMVDMQDYKKRDPQSLSGGQKQRVAIAGVLAIEPKIIIMDESTSMLDPDGRRTVLDLIQNLRKKQSLTVLSITHDIEETQLSDRIIVLKSGKIVKDSDPKGIYDLGPKLIDYGLEEPFTSLVADGLRDELGQEGYVNEEGLIDQLCKLNSKM
ncbi:energy-coupling factor transporter ATPase [Companilactobacillus mishanensis]|uniref:Energy-coupling factor transporter ATPase n=1 Tax=Companilactobacillus mishanensis TaxID=2486008 RepID=A0A5P0ZHH4_9LACO|nr:energy-coupling factor transporter ATPase [Companilactobacillus mishanensis]MQS44886.1 energy-coupling factor transporter ATPase [Companilactobacillus mishanensis]MQS52435.1 energy-coupling factor transporter ATPase [Companilactobacillus mishanensis]MQS89401.1 energy-coupling factor transporter ATPase [Companilactobacillus mishanensis]